MEIAKRFCCAFALLAVTALPCAAAPVHPFNVISPVPLDEGEVNVHVGLSASYDGYLLFTDQDRNRNVVEAPAITISAAVGPRTELHMNYPFLYLDQEGEDGNFGSGDVTVMGQYNLLGDASPLAPSALRIGVKLPNADDEKGFGTDQTDFFVGLGYEKDFEKFLTIVNVDFIILGHPNSDTTEQDDVLAYKWLAGYELEGDILLGLELSGITMSRYDNDKMMLTGGISFPWGKMALDFKSGVGISGNSYDWMIGCGLSFQFRTTMTSSCPLPGRGG